MNVVDSSAWLEYFADGTNADHFAPAIEAVEDLVVPTVVLYELGSFWARRTVRRQQGRDAQALVKT